MRNFLRIAISFLLVIIFHAKAAAELVIGGDDANSVVLELFARKYEQQKKNSVVKIIPSLGSKGGIAALNDGKVEIALVTRLLSASEEAFNLVSVPYAKSCLALAVNQDVAPADDNLTVDALGKIIAGTQTQWSDKQPINVIFRSRGDNGADLLVKNFPELKRSFEKAWATRMWRTEFQDKKSLALLQKINHSIAWAYQTDLLASKSRTRILKLNGIMPGAASIESGEYPLVTTFTLVYKEPAKKEVKEFIKLVKSEFGAKLLRQNEAVPIR